MKSTDVRGLAASLLLLADQSTNHEVSDADVQYALKRWGIERQPSSVFDVVDLSEPTTVTTDPTRELIELRNRVAALEEWRRIVGRHEYHPGYSGMVCDAMVMRYGAGDSCGLPADDPIHLP